ncbi:MAG: hypothetical protein OWU32_11840 [Firmicutes bacterium]|nr:hypothetical protein [Bacillota bacterium]
MDESMFQSTHGTGDSNNSWTSQSSREREAGRERPDDMDTSMSGGPRVIIVKDASVGEHPSHGLRWAIVGLVVGLVIAAVWMTSVSGTLGHLQAVTGQNNQMLNNQQAHLSAISQALANIQASLAALSAQISNFFTSVISLLNRHFG